MNSTSVIILTTMFVVRISAKDNQQVCIYHINSLYIVSVERMYAVVT